MTLASTLVAAPGAFTPGRGDESTTLAGMDNAAPSVYRGLATNGTPPKGTTSMTALAEKTDDYLDSMWGQYSFRKTSMGNPLAKDVVVAHGMVQTFVNAFARDGRYAVSFDADCTTAGTDMNSRSVVITPAPIADLDLTPQEAGKILTGLAVHEISHPRYGRNTWEIVKRVFPGNPVAMRLSNLIDDVRIERSFVADYPGYDGIFDPTLEYVGAAGVKRNGGKLQEQRIDQPVNLAIAAIRYPTFSRWTPQTQVERDWWVDWADRWWSVDTEKLYVAAIREALRHIAALPQSQAPEPQPQDAQAPIGESQSQDQGQGSQDEDDSEDEDDSQQAGSSDDTGDAEDTQSDAGSAGDDEPTDDPMDAQDAQEAADRQKAADAMSDSALNRATTSADRTESEKTDTCSGSKAVEEAAKEGDVTEDELNAMKADAQEIIESERNVETSSSGNRVDVAKSIRGIVDGVVKAPSSPQASRYIRNAILRSRTGHASVDAFQRRGRLDQKGIARIAYGDVRLFERRKAPSVGKYLVWVMVDCSGSMQGAMRAASQVAHAMADATSATPSVRMAVWGWSDPFRDVPVPVDAGVIRVWQTGEDADQILRMHGLPLGGTPDATMMGWAKDAIRREVRGDETPVVIVVSDGEGEDDMNAKVESARQAGIIVKSVSFGLGFSASAQEARFGRGNFVPWAGSILATARGLADMFAKITSVAR